MFEYHGWITVRETATDDDDESRLRQIVDELRLRIAQMDSPYLLDLRWMNGEPFIHLGGYSNAIEAVDAFVATLAGELGLMEAAAYQAETARQRRGCPGRSARF
ncbi:Imm7 family immunity protein [Streptomyces canus]|uniref:Imm7 family immunity protein n=1 Tax=Streptomyces canus TaxID=58343 RepID=UPI00035F139A|nr:Imm7 family immunity protein [Streptomyces canus]